MKNNFRIILRNKSLVFWALAFPLILSTFFNMAFSNMMKSENFKKINIGVVGTGEFLDVTKSLGDVFVVKNVTLEEANKLIDNNKIEGYYVIDGNTSLFVKNSSTSSTIMKYVMDNYNIYSRTYTNISEVKGSILKGIEENNYFYDISSDKNDPTVIYFYSLIGMVCMLAGAFGINLVMMSEANLSKKGARVSVSPKNKIKFLLEGLFASFLIQGLFLAILFCYLIFILDIQFNNYFEMILISLAGIMAGISLGILVGVSNKKNEEVKNSILTTVVMSGSFLSGMMAIDMKLVVENNFPLLARINPVNMITDGLLSLYYNDLSRFYLNFNSLILFTVVMIVISYLFLRGKNYESI